MNAKSLNYLDNTVSLTHQNAESGLDEEIQAMLACDEYAIPEGAAGSGPSQGGNEDGVETREELESREAIEEGAQEVT